MRIQVASNSFYQRMTKVWFALIFLNIAFNVYPLLKKEDTATVVKMATSWSEVCASSQFKAEHSSHHEQVASLASSVGVGSSSHLKKSSVVILPSFNEMAICSRVGEFFFEDTFFKQSLSFLSLQDRGPPQLI